MSQIPHPHECQGSPHERGLTLSRNSRDINLTPGTGSKVFRERSMQIEAQEATDRPQRQGLGGRNRRPGVRRGVHPVGKDLVCDGWMTSQRRGHSPGWGNQGEERPRPVQGPERLTECQRRRGRGGSVAPQSGRLPHPEPWEEGVGRGGGRALLPGVPALPRPGPASGPAPAPQPTPSSPPGPP